MDRGLGGLRLGLRSVKHPYFYGLFKGALTRNKGLIRPYLWGGRLGGRWTSHEYIGGWNTMEYLLMDGTAYLPMTIPSMVPYLVYSAFMLQ